MENACTIHQLLSTVVNYRTNLRAEMRSKGDIYGGMAQSNLNPLKVQLMHSDHFGFSARFTVSITLDL